MKSRKFTKPYRLATLGILISVSALFVFNALLDKGILAETNQGRGIGWIAGTSAVLLTAGLVLNNRFDHFIHYGLVVAAFVWMSRLFFILLSDGFDTFSFWASLAWVLVIIGAFWAETHEPSVVSDATKN